MEKIIEYILNKGNCKFEDLQFFSSKYYSSENLLQIIFVSTLNEIYSQNKLEQLKSIVEDYTEHKFNVEVKVKNQYLSSDALFDKFKKYINTNPLYKTIFDMEKCECKLENNNLIFNLFVDLTGFQTEKDKFEDEVEKLYCNNMLNISFTYKENSKDFELELEMRKILAQDEETEDDEQTKIYNVKNYLGKMEDVSSALMPYQVKAGDKDVFVAGEISNINEIVITKKDGDNEKEVKRYNFNINCPEQSIEAVCFLKLASDLKNLEENQKVVVFGDVEEFNKTLSVRVRALSLCKFDFPVKKQRGVNKFYKFVKPEPYIQTEQLNFLDLDNKITADYLLNNTFVVFDLETTGFSPANCKIIEIGAVKLVNGVITEQFSTFVNPEGHIPEDATKVNNITDEMVKDAPTFKQVFPDFYKFIDGSILVAHNIAFDYPFISYHAKPLGYAITNDRNDTMLLAQKYLYQLKHFKLSNVCDFLGVSLVGAHRAVNDTVATAKCFIKLIENYENNDKNA